MKMHDSEPRTGTPLQEDYPSTEEILATLEQEGSEGAEAPTEGAETPETTEAGEGQDSPESEEQQGKEEEPGEKPPPSSETALLVDGQTYTADHIRELELGQVRRQEMTKLQQRLAEDRRQIEQSYAPYVSMANYLRERGVTPQQFQRLVNGGGNGNAPAPSQNPPEEEYVDPEVLRMRKEFQETLTPLTQQISHLQNYVQQQAREKMEVEKQADMNAVEREIQDLVSEVASDRKVSKEKADGQVRELIQAYVSTSPYLANLPIKKIWTLIEAERGKVRARKDGIREGQRIEQERAEATALGSTTATSVKPADNIDFSKVDYDDLEDKALDAWAKGEL